VKRQHINPSQRIKHSGFLPLLRNENPYFENLNRGSRTAYEYADLINTYTSYGGFLCSIPPKGDQQFQVYDIVRITDDELAITAAPLDAINARYGIVVAEADIDPISGISSNLIVCVFCPNFIYADSGITAVGGGIGDALYLSSNPNTLFLSNLPSSQEGIGSVPIARRVGRSAIFFSGTLRSLVQ